MVAAHGIVVRGPQVSGVLAAPVILQRIEDDFIGAVLADLAEEHGLEEALKPEKVARARTPAGRLKLYQPIQRTFHVVLVETFCDVFGEPRLDPEQIESAGLVIRRCVRTREAQPKRGSTPAVPPLDDVNRLEGWRQAGQKFRTWVPFGDRAEANLDPEPERRPPSLRSGHPRIDRELARYGASVDRLLETTVPLFVAPPDVCRALQRTVLYGVLPTASSDLSELPGAIPYTIDDVRSVVSPYLFAGVNLSVFPAEQYVARDAAETLRHNASFPTFASILAAVQQATFQFGAFDPDSVEGRQLFALLNQHRLPFPGNQWRPVGDWLSDASQLLVVQDQDSGVSSLRMPSSWPAFPAALRQQLLATMQAMLRSRVAGARPQVARFDDGSRVYRLRAFIRRREDGDCRRGPAWSDYSEPFVIAPWYDSSGRPPIKIELPDIDKNFLKNLKPNVAFAVPPKMLNILNNLKLKGLMDGNKPSEEGTTLQWICSFNLLIIFMVAFMVMFVFLIMFNLIFGWLFWVKICIPVPAPSPSPPSPSNA